MLFGKLLQRRMGFTLIEGIVALAVFCILIIVFYRVFLQTTTYMSNSKMRRAAVSLANERMEQYRNLMYAEIGTVENAPFGNIIDDEILTVNGLRFRVISSVFFVDDPIDGSVPSDVLFEDYKRVSVSVLWGAGANQIISKSIAEHGGMYQNKRVRIVSQFVPPGGLETEATGGVLSINVLDSNAMSIADAFVTIYDRVHDTTVTALTDDTGNFMYVGAPTCERCYEITVEKNGYQTVKTEKAFDNGVQWYDPRFVHQSVIAGEITTMVMNTDKTATLTLVAKDPFGAVIPGVSVDVSGGKVLGFDPNNDGESVYNYTGSGVTNIQGELQISTDTNSDGEINESDRTDPGPYKIINNHTEYELWKMQPGDAIDRTRTNVLADTGNSVDVLLLEKDVDSIFFHVVDADGMPISGATVHVVNSEQEYDTITTTDVYGHAYIPNTEKSLVSGEEYVITVSSADYVEQSLTIEVHDLMIQEIIMNEN